MVGVRQVAQYDAAVSRRARKQRPVPLDQRPAAVRENRSIHRQRIRGRTRSWKNNPRIRISAGPVRNSAAIIDRLLNPARRASQKVSRRMRVLRREHNRPRGRSACTRPARHHRRLRCSLPADIDEVHRVPTRIDSHRARRDRHRCLRSPDQTSAWTHAPHIRRRYITYTAQIVDVHLGSHRLHNVLICSRTSHNSANPAAWRSRRVLPGCRRVRQYLSIPRRARRHRHTLNRRRVRARPARPPRPAPQQTIQSRCCSASQLARRYQPAYQIRLRRCRQIHILLCRGLQGGCWIPAQCQRPRHRSPSRRDKTPSTYRGDCRIDICLICHIARGHRCRHVRRSGKRLAPTDRLRPAKMHHRVVIRLRGNRRIHILHRRPRRRRSASRCRPHLRQSRRRTRGHQPILGSHLTWSKLVHHGVVNAGRICPRIGCQRHVQGSVRSQRYIQCAPRHRCPIRLHECRPGNH